MEQLVLMGEQDQLDAGFCDRGSGIAEVRRKISATRLDQYLAVMDELGASCFERFKDGAVRIIAWSGGFPGTKAQRGWEYNTAQVANLVDDLDATGWTGRRTFHKRIDGDWYLFRW